MSYDITNSQKNGYNKDEEELECAFLNKDEEDEMEVYGYQVSRVSSALMWTLVCLTLGVLRLVFHWRPEWMLYLSHRRCPLRQADKVLVLDRYEKRFTSYFIKKVERITTDQSGLQEALENSEPLKQLDPKKLPSVQKIPPIKEFEIHLFSTGIKEVTELRAIWVKRLCYIWDEEKRAFLRLVGLDQGVTKTQLHEYQGYNFQEQYKRRVIYGKNEISVKIQRIPTLVLLEVLNPFYIFQVFTICVWLAELYIYYTFAIILMSVFGVSSSVLQTYQNQRNLHRTVHAEDIVTVKRGPGEYEEIPSSQLVPGDVIVIPARGCVMHCDAALLAGNAIVNESMLTGESVPVTKTVLPYDGQLYSEREDSAHTLFCGTRVLQTRYYGGEHVTAVVLRTGFLTSKGGLVRSILYPPPADFKFDQDSYKFIWILAFIALIGLIYTVVTKSSRGLNPGDILLKALDIITIVIPPALPATMTIGKLYALNRLKKQQISCINPRVINVSGSIDCVCFDKTGTLTEDGLDMWGVVPVQLTDTPVLLGNPLRDVREMTYGHLVYGMASCHSLTIIDGTVSGDPMDMKMFESTGWIFEEPNIEDTSKYDLMVPSVVRPPADKVPDKGQPQPLEIGIIHQYQFSSKLQRMSVLTRQLGKKDLTVYCKGSPEMIQSLSRIESVPLNLRAMLQEYTEQGYRVISLGYRVLDEVDFVQVKNLRRDDIEKDLTFLGLIILENRLKPETTGIIDVLKGAKIKVVMVTGDNLLTAVSVARDCGILELGESVVEVSAEEENNSNPPEILFTCNGEVSKRDPLLPQRYGAVADCELGTKLTSPYRLAITGKSWAVVREHVPELIPKIAVRGAVFARMSSDQKQQLIQELQQIGYYVVMCGDGANDCGALKAAHAGISLSEAEASVASPFTSAQANISCVPKVIKEGRAALVTSFGIFKFMVLYSIMEFMSTIILYSIDSNLTDFEFLFIDVCLVVQLAFTFGRNRAYSGPLVSQAPLTSLLSRIPLMSLLLQIVLMSGIQLLSFSLVHKYSWFTPFVYSGATNYICYENYAVFAVSQFQYIIMAVVFSQGAPYRQPFYKNTWFFCSVCLMTLVCCYITLVPAQWVVNVLQLRFPPEINFPLVVIGLAFCNFIISVFFEKFVVQYLMFTKLKDCNEDLKDTNREYLSIDKELNLDKDWPPILKTDQVTRHSTESRVKGVENFAFEGDSPKQSRHTTKL